MTIDDRIKRVREEIQRAAFRAGRNPDDVTLIGVSKTVDRVDALAAVERGVTDLGENRVQSLLDKQDYIGDRARWHLIGHLQTNKARQIVGRVSLIHSVDSIRIAAELSRRAREAGVVQDVLIQVNASGEATKYGVTLEETEETALAVAALPGLRVRGLMTMAPLSDNPEDSRKYFSALHKKFVDIGQKKYDNINMGILSMGMTGDFAVAIEEGATMVRIGRGIFTPAEQ